MKVVEILDTDPSGELQTAKTRGAFGDDDTRVSPIVGMFGVEFRPPDGANAVQALADGDSGEPLIVATFDERYRPTNLQKGEGVIYSHEGDVVRFKLGKIFSFEGEEARFGANATDPLVRKSDLQAVINQINLRLAALSAHTHSGTPSAGTFPTATPIGTFASLSDANGSPIVFSE